MPRPPFLASLSRSRSRSTAGSDEQQGEQGEQEQKRRPMQVMDDRSRTTAQAEPDDDDDDGAAAVMSTPREHAGAVDDDEGEEEEEVMDLPMEDAAEEEEEEEEEGGAGATMLEAEVIWRRDARMGLGQTTTGPLPPPADGEEEEQQGGGQKARRDSHEHARSLASMEEGAPRGGALAAEAGAAPPLAREPSVSLSLSSSSSQAAAAKVSAAMEQSEAAPTAAGATPAAPTAATAAGGGVGGVAAMLRTLRLQGSSASSSDPQQRPPPPQDGDGERRRPRRGGSGLAGILKRLSALQPGADGGHHHRRHRGPSNASASTTSSSGSSTASSTRSHRIMGMDEPTAVAAALVAMSAFIVSLESVNVKLLGKDVGFWTISVWRGVVGLLCCLASYHCGGRRGPQTHWLGKPELRGFLAVRGAMGAAAVISSFAALTSMDLADATSLMSTAPLWTALMAVLMQKGIWSRYDSAATVCCTVGVLLVLQPGPLFPGSAAEDATGGAGLEVVEGGSSPRAKQRNTAFGVVSAIVCAVTTAAFTIMTRYVMEENTSVVSGYAMAACILLALPGLVYELVTRPPGQRLVHGWGYDLVQLMLTGLFSYAAHMAKTYAMQVTRSLGVVVMRYLNILFAFVFELFLLHQRVDPLGAAGAAVIVAGCCVSILAQGGRGQVVSSHQKQQPSSASDDDALATSAALAAAVIKEADEAAAAAEAAAGRPVVRLPAA